MTDAQKQSAPGSLRIPTVAGAVTPVVNLPGIQPGQLKLTEDTLATIELGQITKWNDPRLMADNQGVNLPDQDIIVVRRANGSGTKNIFTTYLSAVSQTWRDQVGDARRAALRPGAASCAAISDCPAGRGRPDPEDHGWWECSD